MSQTQPTLGEFLRREREKQGITIEQVASATKISVRLLQALEEDHYNKLPARTFVKGFVNSYSRFINIDSRDVLSKYGGYIQEKAEKQRSGENGFSGYAFEKRDTEKSRKLLAITMGSLLVLGIFFIFVLKPVLKSKRIAHIQKLRAAKEQTQAPQETPKEEKKGESAPVVTAKADDVKVENKEEADSATTEERKPDPLKKGDALFDSEVKQKVILYALADIQLRYQSDDLDAMMLNLKKGKYLMLRAKNLIRLQVSNPKSVKIKYRTGNYQELEGNFPIENHNDTTTLFFSQKRFDKDPFPGMAALERTPDPVPETKAPTTSSENGQEKTTE